LCDTKPPANPPGIPQAAAAISAFSVLDLPANIPAQPFRTRLAPTTMVTQGFLLLIFPLDQT
jgi:hypothetical protein